MGKFPCVFVREKPGKRIIYMLIFRLYIFYTFLLTAVAANLMRTKKKLINKIIGKRSAGRKVGGSL